MLSDLNGEHGHVVVLGGVADEGEDVRFDVVEQIGGVFVAVLYDGAGELFEAPLFGFGVHGFGDAIGVGNDEVAGLELYVSGFGDGAEGGVVDEPDGDAWGFGAVDLIASAVQDEGGFVPGAGVAEEAGFGVENHVEHADEHIVGEVEGEGLVEGGEHAGGIVFVLGVGLEYAAADGHHEGATNAFAADVGDDESNVLGVDFDHVVVVAADVERGVVEAGELDVG